MASCARLSSANAASATTARLRTVGLSARDASTSASRAGSWASDPRAAAAASRTSGSGSTAGSRRGSRRTPASGVADSPSANAAASRQLRSGSSQSCVPSLLTSRCADSGRRPACSAASLRTGDAGSCRPRTIMPTACSVAFGSSSSRDNPVTRLTRRSVGEVLCAGCAGGLPGLANAAARRLRAERAWLASVGPGVRAAPGSRSCREFSDDKGRASGFWRVAIV